METLVGSGNIVIGDAGQFDVLSQMGGQQLGGHTHINRQTNVNSVLVDVNEFASRDVELARQIHANGYPNVYGARIPVQTEWRLEALAQELQDYDDLEVVDFMRYGWPANKLPYDNTCSVTKTNHSSADDYLEFIDGHIEKELKSRAIFGPFDYIPFTDRVAISPMSTRPKKGSTDRRTIMDLSFPPGKAVNNGIPKDTYLGLQIKLKYPTVDDLAQKISEAGPRIWMWKRDLAKYFRQIPLDPGDYHLFGLRWRNKMYWSRMLVMGHRAAPYIAQRVSTALKFIHQQKGYIVFNYIDDFLGVDDMSIIHESFQEFADMLSRVGCREAESKAEPPNYIMEFLGVLFNSLMGTMSITDARLHEIGELVVDWLDKLTCTRNELEQLIGKLQFVSSCVRPARIFICRLLTFLCGMNRGVQYTIPLEVRRDLLWWRWFLPEYNGKSVMWMEQFPVPDAIISTDASLRGIGGTFEQSMYFRLTLPPRWRNVNIAFIEMLAVCVALKVWGQRLRGKHIVIYSDNQSVVSVINSGAAKNLFLQACSREIMWLAAKGSFEIKAAYINTKCNVIPDLLSRWPMGGGLRRKFLEIRKDMGLRRTKIPLGSLQFSHDW